MSAFALRLVHLLHTRCRTRQGTLSGAGSFTWLNVSTQRSITALGLNSVTAKYNETAFSARVEAAYEIARFSSGALSPFGNLQIQSARNPNFTETAGGAAAGVSVAGQTNVTSRSVVGMDIIVCTTAKNDTEARALLAAFNFPFRQ